MKYLGVLVALVGAVLLMLSAAVPSMDNNTVLGGGLFLVVAGFVGHILINKYVAK